MLHTVPPTLAALTSGSSFPARSLSRSVRLRSRSLVLRLHSLAGSGTRPIRIRSGRPLCLTPSRVALGRRCSTRPLVNARRLLTPRRSTARALPARRSRCLGSRPPRRSVRAPSARAMRVTRAPPLSRGTYAALVAVARPTCAMALASVAGRSARLRLSRMLRRLLALLRRIGLRLLLLVPALAPSTACP
jgi:hypothetical protein